MRPPRPSNELLQELPKTDLHVHLDGSLRLSSLIEMATERSVKLPSYTEAGLKELVFKPSYESLPEYLEGFAYTTAVMQDAEALERAAFELAEDSIAEGVVYVEVRFAPQLHIHDRLSIDEILKAVHRGMQRAQDNHRATVQGTKAPVFHYGIIVCALRWFTGEFSAWYGRLCSLFPDAHDVEVFGLASMELARAAIRLRDEESIPIVGFDLAGREDGYPAHDHRDAFLHAHRNFLKKTVHAGEAYGPESIFDAITELNADRLGHGYYLFGTDKCGPDIGDPHAYVRRLSEYVADRRITVEVCITSNLQTNPALHRVEDHIFGRMLRERLSATLCTDNRLVSHTTVTREYRLACDAFEMTPGQLRNTIIHGFKRSFFPGSYAEKRAWVRQIIDYYDAVTAAHGWASAWRG
jgi:adenosine deaminase